MTRRALPFDLILRLGLSAGLLLMLAGYLGPWIGQRAAGLVVVGYDLAEYVKFLGEVRAGALSVWREWFLLPAAALSISLTLVAVNRRLALRWYVAGALLLASLLAALALLPPAWTPALLLTPEFRKQTALLAGCLLLFVLAPLARRLPLTPLALLVSLLPAAAAAGAVRQFLLVKPAIDRVYGRPATVGWGFWLFIAGGVLLLALIRVVLDRRRRD